jgi:hypothetical protein
MLNAEFRMHNEGVGSADELKIIAGGNTTIMH